MSEKKKSGCLGRLIRCLLWCVLGLVALTVVLLATVPLWISPVATSVANNVVPRLTGTDFRMERCYVNPWTGTVCINGVRLSNPKGFGDTPAFSMTSFTLDLAVTELFSNTLHIEELLIEDPFASYYSHDGVNNFDAILENVNKALGEKKEKEKEEEKEVAEEKSELKIIIDHLRISGTKVKLMETSVIPPISIITIELNDIGKKSNGASFEEVWKEISAAFMNSMGSIGDGLNALGGFLGDGAKGLSDVIGEGTKNVSGTLAEGTKSLTGALEKAASATGDGVSSAAETTIDKTKGAASGAVDLTKNAAGAIGDGAKAAVDAVGDTTKKAAEGVKDLFKGFGK